MKLLYVKEFFPKELGLPPISANRVYEGESDGDEFVLKLDDTDFTIGKEAQSGPRFDSEIVEITLENYLDFKYTQEDSLKVIQYLVKPQLDQLAKKLEANNQAIFDKLQHNIKHLAQDMSLLSSLSEVTEHILNTYNDKYENTPDADLTGLMRFSSHSAGFNIGNTLKYCRRYLSTGYPKSNQKEDLLKAIHYLLLEVISHNNSQDENK